MEDATNFGEKYLNDNILNMDAEFHGYAVNDVFGDSVYNAPVAYTIDWR